MDTNAWLAYHQERPHARLRLFCFPYAGGGASIYRTWSENLPEEIEVCPVQLPSREQRMKEQPFTRLSELVPALIEALRPYMDLPFAFFGHSMGALISFELARTSYMQGFGPTRLLISACAAPQLPTQEPPAYSLPDGQFIKRLRHLDGTPDEVLSNPELMELKLPLLRADFALFETYTYTPQEPLPCPIIAYGGSQDRKISYQDLEAWQEQTINYFAVRMFSGNHFYLHHVREALLQTIIRDLD